MNTSTATKKFALATLAVQLPGSISLIPGPRMLVAVNQLCRIAALRLSGGV
jgi:hypothetical protein